MAQQTVNLLNPAPELGVRDLRVRLADGVDGEHRGVKDVNDTIGEGEERRACMSPLKTFSTNALTYAGSTFAPAFLLHWSYEGEGFLDSLMQPEQFAQSTNSLIKQGNGSLQETNQGIRRRANPSTVAANCMAPCDQGRDFIQESRCPLQLRTIAKFVARWYWRRGC